MSSIVFQPGTIIDGKYEIQSLLGEGGMGSVYIARELDLGRLAAVKVLLPCRLADEDSRARFLREAKILSALSHENIVQFYRFGLWQDSLPYIAMEFLQGQSLREVIDENGPLPWERAVRIVLQICQAMQKAHDAGIVHRDLKPSNVILLDTPADTVKLVDFGLSMVNSDAQKLTQTGALVGSLFYMSPEQARGQRAEPSSDIYALGCILYEALAGVIPLTADNPVGLLHKHVQELPALLSSKSNIGKMPKQLEDICFKAMAKTTAERYTSMSDFERDLSSLLAGRLTNVLAAPLTVSKTPIRKQGKPLICLGVAGLLVLCVFVSNDPGLAWPLSHLFKTINTKESVLLARDSAERLESSGRLRGAELMYSAAAFATTDSISSAQRVLDRAHLGRVLYKEGKVNEAIDCFADTLGLAYANVQGKAYPCEQLSVLMSGLKIAAEHLCLCDLTNDERFERPAKYLHKYASNYDSDNIAMKSLTELEMQLAKHKGDLNYQMWLSYQLGDLYRRTAKAQSNDINKAISSFSQTINLAQSNPKSNGGTWLLIMAYMKRGLCYEQTNKIESALQDYAMSGSLLHQCNATQETPGLSSALGDHFISLNNQVKKLERTDQFTLKIKPAFILDKAKEYLSFAIALAKSRPEPAMKTELAVAYLRRAVVYMESGERQKAEDDIDQLAELARESTDPEPAIHLISLVLAYEKYLETLSPNVHPLLMQESITTKNRFTKSIAYLSEAISLCETHYDPAINPELVNAYFARAAVYHFYNQPQKANNDLRRVESLLPINQWYPLRPEQALSLGCWYNDRYLSAPPGPTVSQLNPGNQQLQKYNPESLPKSSHTEREVLLKKSLLYYTQAIATAEQTNDPSLYPYLMRAYAGRANLLRIQKQPDKAREDYTKLICLMNGFFLHQRQDFDVKDIQLLLLPSAQFFQAEQLSPPEQKALIALLEKAKTKLPGGGWDSSTRRSEVSKEIEKLLGALR